MNIYIYEKMENIEIENKKTEKKTEQANKRNKKFDSILSLVLTQPDSTPFFLIGKHSSGPNENKWGFPSVKINENDDRPQDTASKLFEVCTLGMYGSLSKTKKKCVLQGKTVHGISVYTVEVEKNVELKIKNISKYLLKCFPLGGIPTGVLAWKRCKMVSIEEIILHTNLDAFTKETVEFLRCQNHG